MRKQKNKKLLKITINNNNRNKHKVKGKKIIKKNNKMNNKRIRMKIIPDLLIVNLVNKRYTKQNLEK